MTMVATLTTPDRVEIVVDSLANTPNCRHVISMRDHKATVLDPLTAACASTGPMLDGVAWRSHLTDLARRPGMTFDRIVKTADARAAAADGTLTQFYAVGLSEAVDAFSAWAWAPWTDWKPLDVSGWHVQPHPYGLARGDDLLDRQAAYHAANGVDVAGMVLPDGPDRSPPRDAKGWEAVCRAVRRTRAEQPADMRLRNPMGGVIRRTTLTRTGQHTDLIAVLDHPDVRTATPGFVKMMTFTQHPTFQLGPCPCGSGQPNYQCHQPELLHGKPCTCRSGRLFEDCCRVDGNHDEPPILDGIIVHTEGGPVMEARNVVVTA